MKYRPATSEPHPLLVPALERHGLTHAQFVARGRPPKDAPTHLHAARRAIVTELHLSGLTWAELIVVTGLSLPSIARLTEAKGSEVTRQHLRDNAAKTGRAGAGKKRPAVGEILKRRWAAGEFNSLRGRPLSPEQRARMRASFTPERRAKLSAAFRALWRDPSYRGRLETYHRSPEERLRRSQAQAIRLVQRPTLYSRGRAEWVPTPKGAAERTYARSSYEVAAIRRLESDPEVVSYEHERRFVLPTGRWVLPDFVVTYRDGKVLLIEVKASWVLKLAPEERTQVRLDAAAALARNHGFVFALWTEKELKQWLPQETARVSAQLSVLGGSVSAPSLPVEK